MLRKPIEYRIEEGSGCWTWLKATRPNGYGVKKVGGKLVGAHRWYYERAKGKIPEGLTIDHACRNRLCVNPEHLEAVPNAVNVQRGAHTRLTRGDVTMIRTSAESNRALAARLGVSYTTIRNARVGETWK
jgi:hypothetical protein